MSPTTFTVTAAHVRLLERTFIGWWDYAYDGAPGVDPKRPFGNSDVMSDVHEISTGEPAPESGFTGAQTDALMALFREMEYVIQIAVNLAGKGELIKPGVYHRPGQYDHRTWVAGPRPVAGGVKA